MKISHAADIAIIGGGLAGIVSALELLDSNQKVLIIDRDNEENFGGLAKDAFGGMALVNTPIQKLLGVKDTPEIALQDWLNFAEFSEQDRYPRAWAELYVNRSRVDIYDWLGNKGIHFFPVPHWVERGEFGQGNSVPRYHVIWGTGRRLITQLISHLENHPKRDNLKLLFQHKVEDLDLTNGEISGCHGIDESNGKPFEIDAPTIIVASGGINGSIERVKACWDKTWGKPPETILNGAHKYADGTLHDAVDKIGGNITNLHQMWNYAAGVHHPKPRMANEGLSLIPPKSALWMRANGERFGPFPLVTGFDTHLLCKRVATDEYGYSWQIMNQRIAEKEIAVSGADSNPAFRDRKLIKTLKDVMLGNKGLIKDLVDNCPDFVTGETLDELVDKMNTLTGTDTVDLDTLRREIIAYDEEIARGEQFFNDEQLKRISHVRHWRGDKVRTCKFQKILDPKAMPLIAVREYIVSRKSMGGVQTDLQSRVIGGNDQPIPGLYAAGEAAGFGGGGISGLKSLEGTFLSNCILNAQMAARSIKDVELTP